MRTPVWRTALLGGVVFRRTVLAVAAATLLCSFLFKASALVLYGVDDPAYNTSEPDGDLAGSGWQLQGRWIGFLGTPISSNLFLTAKHTKGAVGDKFIFQGAEYTTVASFPDPDTDLAIWKVCGSFPAFATLYGGGDEVGKRCVVFGPGMIKGGPVSVTNGLSQSLKGWKWVKGDGRLRWGENRIDRVYNGGVGVGDLLAADLDADGGTNEACLAGGDSGGGLFIQDGNAWRLAGVNYAADGPYNTSDSGEGFYAAVFDGRGLYEWTGTQWKAVPDGIRARPGAFYVTRVSARLEWIQSVIAANPPQDSCPTLLTAAEPQGPYVECPEAVVDPVARTITAPAGGERAFFRVRYCRSVRLSRIAAWADRVQVQYE